MQKSLIFIGVVLSAVACQNSDRELTAQSSGSSQIWLTKHLADQVRVSGTVKECGERTVPPVLKKNPNGPLADYVLSSDQEVAQALAQNEACLKTLTRFIENRELPQTPQELENLAVYYKGELAAALKQAVQPMHPTFTGTAIATAGGASALVSAANTGTAWGEGAHAKKYAKSAQNLRRLGHLEGNAFKIANDKVRARIADARPYQARSGKAMKRALGAGVLATGLISYLIYTMNLPTNVQVQAQEAQLLDLVHMDDQAFRDHMKAHPDDATFIVRVVQTWSPEGN